VSEPDGRGRQVDWTRVRDVLISVIAAGVIVWYSIKVLLTFAETVLIVVLATFLAFALNPIVYWLTQRRLPRFLAVVIVYLVILGLLAGGGYWISSNFITEVGTLKEQSQGFKATIDGTVDSVQQRFAGWGVKVDVRQQLDSAISGTQETLTASIGQGAKLLSGAAFALIDGVLILFVSAYFVTDAPRIARSTPRLVPHRYRWLVRFLEAAVFENVGGFIRGQFIMAVIVGVTSGAVSWFLGLPHAIALGVVSFFFEFFPNIGPILIGILLGIVALFESFQLFLEAMAFYVVLHTVEAYVLEPRIVGSSVGLSPVASVLALVAGAEVGGIFGALVAIPVASLLQTLAVAAIEAWKDESGPASEVVLADHQEALAAVDNAGDTDVQKKKA